MFSGLASGVHIILRSHHFRPAGLASDSSSPTFCYHTNDPFLSTTKFPSSSHHADRSRALFQPAHRDVARGLLQANIGLDYIYVGTLLLYTGLSNRLFCTFSLISFCFRLLHSRIPSFTLALIPFRTTPLLHLRRLRTHRRIVAHSTTIQYISPHFRYRISLALVIYAPIVARLTTFRFFFKILILGTAFPCHRRNAGLSPAIPLSHLVPRHLRPRFSRFILLVLSFARPFDDKPSHHAVALPP